MKWQFCVTSFENGQFIYDQFILASEILEIWFWKFFDQREGKNHSNSANDFYF